MTSFRFAATKVGRPPSLPAGGLACRPQGPGKARSLANSRLPPREGRGRNQGPRWHKTSADEEAFLQLSLADGSFVREKQTYLGIDSPVCMSEEANIEIYLPLVLVKQPNPIPRSG